MKEVSSRIDLHLVQLGDEEDVRLSFCPQCGNMFLISSLLGNV